jgi:hypothetical protein
MKKENKGYASTAGQDISFHRIFWNKRLALPVKVGFLKTI